MASVSDVAISLLPVPSAPPLALASNGVAIVVDSFGVFGVRTVAEAARALEEAGGGRICLMPGTYARVSLSSSVPVVLAGVEGQDAPVIEDDGATGYACVDVSGGASVSVENVVIRQRGNAPAVQVRRGFARVTGCRISSGGQGLVVAGGESSLTAAGCGVGPCGGPGAEVDDAASVRFEACDLFECDRGLLARGGSRPAGCTWAAVSTKFRNCRYEGVSLENACVTLDRCEITGNGGAGIVAKRGYAARADTPSRALGCRIAENEGRSVEGEGGGEGGPGAVELADCILARNRGD
eukprot:tig00000367_g24454.t1